MTQGEQMEMDNHLRIGLFYVSRLVSRNNAEKSGSGKGKIKKTSPARSMRELPFVRWHYYICPNYGSKVCEQRTTILN